MTASITGSWIAPGFASAWHPDFPERRLEAIDHSRPNPLYRLETVEPSGLDWRLSGVEFEVAADVTTRYAGPVAPLMFPA